MFKVSSVLTLVRIVPQVQLAVVGPTAIAAPDVLAPWNGDWAYG